LRKKQNIYILEWKIAHEKNINTHRNSDFTAHNIRLTIFYFIVLYLSYIFNTGTWSEACIIELLILLLSVLITFCLFFEFARNSSFFYLKRICSINNTLFLTAVPDRLKCVISLVDYLILCAVKSLFLCVLIFFHVLFFTFFTPVYRCFAFSSIFRLQNCIQVCSYLKSIRRITIFCIVAKPLSLCVFIPNGFPYIYFSPKRVDVRILQNKICKNVKMKNIPHR
jgi:hypothetical protein